MNALANLAVWWIVVRKAITALPIVLLLIAVVIGRGLIGQALLSARRRPRYALGLLIVGVILAAGAFLIAALW